jgi:hypothetical protein
MKNILTVLMILVLGSARAEEWRIYDEVGTPPNAAMICHFWSATIFSHDEELSCMFGTLYTVDLEKREIRYQNRSETGLPLSRSDRNLNRSTLISALEDDGFTRLEELRAKQMAVQEKQKAQVAAEKARAEYLASFEAAKTLRAIQAFESRYADDDPDGLIPKLQSLRERLRYDEYRAAYAGAKLSSELAKFLTDYAAYDPDHLLVEARKRMPLMQKQEQLEQQRAERQRQEEKRQEELAAKKTAAEKDKNRQQYIQSLHTKYSGNIVFDSSEGRSLVIGYQIDCRTSDGRVLPLSHVLYALMAQADGMGGKLIASVKSAGKQVRIYTEIYKNGKMIVEPSLRFQLSEWGELRPVGISTESVLNSCLGSYGPLWLMPGESGYR